MARFIVNSQEFEKLKELRERIIYNDTVLPANVFRASYSAFRIMDEAYLLSEKFLGLALSVAKDTGVSQMVVVTIDPDPTIYYRGCGRFGGVVFDSNDTPEAILSTCMEYPPDEPQWSITLTGNTMALFPLNYEVPDWCVYRDHKYCEAGVIGFKSEDLASRFMTKDTGHIITDAKDAVETFMGLAFHPKYVVPDDFKREFLRNYTDKVELTAKP